MRNSYLPVVILLVAEFESVVVVAEQLLSHVLQVNPFLDIQEGKVLMIPTDVDERDLL